MGTWFLEGLEGLGGLLGYVLNEVTELGLGRSNSSQ